VYPLNHFDLDSPQLGGEHGELLVPLSAEVISKLEPRNLNPGISNLGRMKPI
jgi:hypothetical protein